MNTDSNSVAPQEPPNGDSTSESVPSFGAVENTYPPFCGPVALFAVTGLLLLAVVSGSYYYYRSISTISNFNAELGKLNTESGFVVPPKATVDKFNMVKFKGKILPVFINSNEVDTDFYDFLAPDIKPGDISEVNSFVWKECELGRLVDYFNDGSGAFEKNCVVTVVDRAENVIVARKTFVVQPVIKKLRSESGMGAPPYGEMAAWLYSNVER